MAAQSCQNLEQSCQNVAQSAFVCQLCDKNNVQWKCEDCGIFMCSTCKEKIHPRLKSSERHRIVSIKDIWKADPSVTPVVLSIAEEVLTSPGFDQDKYSVNFYKLDYERFTDFDLTVDDFKYKVPYVVDRREKQTMTTDNVHVSKSVSMCQVCNHHNVKWKCEECSIYMCNDCKKEIHPRIRSSASHKISSITDIGKNICYEDQPWYHGNITHTEAVNLLQKHKHMGDGSFLVRESQSNIGSFTIDCMRNGAPIQIQIQPKEKYGQMKYYVGGAQFDGLNDIIQFFKSNVIAPRVMLTEPVLQETYF